MRKCECGTEVDYDGYESIEIVDGYVEIRGCMEGVTDVLIAHFMCFFKI